MSGRADRPRAILAPLEIESVAFGGGGVGRIDGKVCFAPGALPGEIVEVDLIKEKKRHWIARPKKLVRSSPERIEPLCPFARRVEDDPLRRRPVCPGCAYQHVEYESELAFKHRQLENMIAQSGIEGWTAPRPIPSGRPVNYRNKITLSVSKRDGDTRLGYFMEDNETVLDVAECPLAHPEINEKLTSLRRKPGFEHSLRDGMRLTFRRTENDGVAFWRNRPPRNSTWLKEATSRGLFSVPIDGFFQVNPRGLEALFEIITHELRIIKPRRVVDLYCGVGVFSVAAADEAAETVVGVDQDPQAIQAARHNAERRGLNQCEFRRGDAAKLGAKILSGPAPDETLLIVDPPRTGLPAKLRGNIGRSEVEEMIYVACAADTMVRDVDDLCRHGWRPLVSRIVDMFPRTAHFETVTRLRRVR